MRRLRRHLLAELRVEARGRGCPGSRRSTREAALPRFLYAKEPAPERETPLERLLARMTAEERVRSFATPGELAELLVDDLAALLSQRFHGDRASVQDLPRGNGLVSLRRHRRFDAARPAAGRRLPSRPRCVPSHRHGVDAPARRRLSPISMATAPSPRSPFPPRPRGRRSTSSANSRAPPGRRT